MSKQTYSVCFCFRRRFKTAAAEAPDDIKAIFDEYSENGEMSVDQMRRFLVEVQREENTMLEDAQAVMDSLHELKHLDIFHKRGLLNLELFFKYLFGDGNPPLNPKIGVHHDMNAPLSHYFIYTGHNSYLTGNQLSSDCSDVPIIKALHNGVRVIELDIWPNSAKDNINVLHGRTLTTPVELIKCLRSIKEHAFAASDYPVVITLEDHLSPDLQAKAAEMISETFGDMLFSPGPECLTEFPSPEALKRRVVISTKPPKEYLHAKDVKIQESDSKKGTDLEKEEPWGREIKSFKTKIDEDKDVGIDGECHEEDEDEEEDPNPRQYSAPEYRRLIAIHAGKGKGGMKDWLRVYPDKVRRLSLSEQELEKAIATYGKDIVRFTQKNLLRVYPKGIRFDSSNYSPLIGWMHGAQMVAFNMQGYGRSLWLMHGMFRANGGCGYVKKPDCLLKAGGDVFDPKVTLPVKTTLRVTVYMGEGWYYDFKHTHFDAYSPPDFYARVGIAGVPADVIMKKTKPLEDNWIPTWDEVFDFPLTVPELALLRIEVHEYDMSEKDDFAGQTCLPVSEVRKGIRAVPLHSHKGERYKSVKLLMRFEFI
ncbi:1-phosphatidylinositol phosphodiesterase [Orobanche hederae]